MWLWRLCVKSMEKQLDLKVFTNYQKLQVILAKCQAPSLWLVPDFFSILLKITASVPFCFLTEP